MEMNKLTVHHYEEVEIGDRRITLSPINIIIVAAEIEDVMVRGRSVRNVSVMFIDGSNVALALDHADLDLLEGAVGAFCFG